MNTHMWDSPFTGRQLEVLTSLGAAVIPPISKRLACGDVGNGALAAVDTIVAEMKRVTETLRLPAAEAAVSCPDSMPS